MTSDPEQLSDGERERLWLAYLEGYEYGTAYGMTAGYREAITDVYDFPTDPKAAQRLRLRPSHAELTARRRAAMDRAAPPLTAEQIRARAAASWGGLTRDAPPTGPSDATGPVPCSTPRGARRRVHHP